jgi:uridine kinase
MRILWNYSDLYVQNIIINGDFYLTASSIALTELTRVIFNQLKFDFPKVLSIVGGAASGKSTLASSLAKTLKNCGMDSILILNTDDYSVGTRSFRENLPENIDPYITHDFKLLAENVDRILRLIPGEQITIPRYNPSNGSGVYPLEFADSTMDREKFLTQLITGPVKLIIVEGDFQPLKETDYIIYLHLPDKARLENRLRRDIHIRNYKTRKNVIKSFKQRQVSQHNPYTLPLAENANAIIWSVPEKKHKQSTFLYDFFLKK